MSSQGDSNEAPTVQVPDELPVLTRSISRILLDILVDLTEVETLDGSSGEGSHDA